jgi:hypothetical protein
VIELIDKGGVLMNNITALETCYQTYMQTIPQWAPEGVVEVDLELLRELDLLNFYLNQEAGEPSFTRYFQLVESNEKITLINEQFIVWIVPQKINGVLATHTLIALNNSKKPSPEVIFVNIGIYNTSKLVLRVLEKYLHEIQENEDLLKSVI